MVDYGEDQVDSQCLRQGCWVDDCLTGVTDGAEKLFMSIYFSSLLAQGSDLND